MKKLIFVRHGRAEDLMPDITDFERSLTAKGKVIAREMAGKMKQIESDPGLIITSPAFRALETALIFASVLGVKHEKVVLDGGLYHRAGLKYLMDLLEKTSNDIDTITMFGHNPAFTEMPDRLCKEGCEFLTKTSIVCLSFPADKWSALKPDTGKLVYFLKP
ncbi:MAG: histidine phosphatase family protein [Bacteroidales bacterium]|nr:histidine phosphatase family protein [Bacteroidales bacterium]